MSNTSNPSVGSDADGSHFTIEDAGTTTDAADLVQGDETIAAGQAGTIGETTAASDRAASPNGDRSEVVSESQVTSGSQATASDPDAPSAPGAPEPPQAPTGGIAALADDPSIGHVFDQTNGVIDGLDGDSDGTADGDEHSSAERADENPAFEEFADTEAASSGDTDDTRVTGN